VILMIDWGLSCSPLSVSIREGWVSWKNLSDVPEEQVRVIHKRLCVQGVVVQKYWSVMFQTSAETS